MDDDGISSSNSVLAWTILAAAAGLFGLAWTVILAPHVYRIFRPSIVAYPWNNETKDGETPGRRIPQTVIFAASYNPPHNGHLRMLEYLSEHYERVVAVVGFNPDKTYLVSPEERAGLLRDMVKSSRIETNVAVEVVEGYIWRYAMRIGATLFFRGIRSWDKDGSDERFLQILNTWGPLLYGPLAVPIPTVYIEGDPKYNHVSSTLIRTICAGTDASGGGAGANNDDETVRKQTTVAALSELVPPGLAGRVAELYGAPPR